MELKAPAHKTKYLGLDEPLELWLVIAKEVDPPAGVEAICWRVWTTVEIGSATQAKEIIGWYAKRWMIEELHRILKSGCKVEERQLESIGKLTLMLALDLIVASHLLGLTKAARDNPEQAASTWLERDLWEALYCRRLYGGADANAWPMRVPRIPMGHGGHRRAATSVPWLQMLDTTPSAPLKDPALYPCKKNHLIAEFPFHKPPSAMRTFPTCLAALALVTSPLVADKPKQPNILFIFSDDHALQAITAYGNSRYAEHFQTPNLDRIAAEGALFVNSFCANSICGPSRACVLTGKHSVHNGHVDNSSRFDGSQPTFPQALKGAGYETALIGKWHLYTEPTGFDYWEVLPGQGSYWNPDFIQMDGSTERFEGYVTDIITDKSLDWLENRKSKDKPFVLMSQHKAPHRNWMPAERHLMMFDGIDLPEPETLFDDYANRSEALKKQQMTISDHFFWGWDMFFHEAPPAAAGMMDGLPNREYERMTPLQQRSFDFAYGPRQKKFLEDLAAGKLTEKEITSWKYQRYIKNYLRTIRAVDENVGRLLDYLDEHDLADNTIVIYSSDQSFYLGEKGWYDKRWMFEESLTMPFIMRWPGVVKPGIRPEALIQNIDYAPTFLEIAGLDVPDDIQGHSLVPILKNEGKAPGNWRDAIYYFYTGEGTHRVPAHDGVRTDRYKIFHLPRTDEWQLFDLVEDPKEQRSVHADPAYAEVFTKMKGRYEELRTRYKIPEGLPK